VSIIETKIKISNFLLCYLDLDRIGHYTTPMAEYHVIPEEAVVDYVTCPLAYALAWYYDVAVPTRRGALRSGLSVLFKLAYEGRLNYDRLAIAIQKESDKQSPYGIPPTPIVKYASTIIDSKVLAYNTPVDRRIGRYRFVGIIDAILVKDSTLTFVHACPIPFSSDNKLRHTMTGLVQTALPPALRKFVRSKKWSTTWSSLYFSLNTVHSETIEEQKDMVPFLSGVARGLAAGSYYPRYNRSICRHCAYKNVCSPTWGSARKIRTRLDTRAQIIEEMTAWQE